MTEKLEVVRQHIIRNLAMYKGGLERTARQGFSYLNDSTKSLKDQHGISDIEWRTLHAELTFYRSKFNDQRIKLNNLDTRIKALKGSPLFSEFNNRIRKIHNEVRKLEILYLAKTTAECKDDADSKLAFIKAKIKVLEKEIANVR